jgi:hypothetical protein
MPQVTDLGNATDFVMGRLHGGDILLAHRASGRVVRSGMTADEMSDEAVLVLDVYNRAESFVTFEYHEETYLVEIGGQETVLGLKRKIRDLLGIQVARQRLRKGESEIAERASIRQAKVFGERLVLTVAEESGWAVQVRVGDCCFAVPVQDGNEGMSDVKWFVCKKTGLKEEEFDLIVPGKRFEEEDLGKEIFECGIHEGSRVFAMPRFEDGIEVLVSLPAGDVRVALPREQTRETLLEIVRNLGLGRAAALRLFVAGEPLAETTEIVDGISILVV